MGVPLFFGWLRRRYPGIVGPHLDVIAADGSCCSGSEGGFFCDNLYRPARPGRLSALSNFHSKAALCGGFVWARSLLNSRKWRFPARAVDMNGIIHQCSHPIDRPAPATEDGMFEEMCRYIDRLVALTRPGKLVYMAIDGVAPRAKMNQQRTRRFRAAMEAAATATPQSTDVHATKQKWASEGLGGVEAQKAAHFDSNVITPGTPFMQRCAAAFRAYAGERLAGGGPPTAREHWRRLSVVLSDATVPGEGEHKIMDYVRAARQQPEHDPNTRHAIYGMDADLILLAMASHEPHFWVIREVLPGR
jgi:5'-3' exoribonuclease 2